MSVRVESWIKPQFVWTLDSDSFVVVVSTEDSDVTRFISVGSCEFTFCGSKRLAATMAALRDTRHSLHSELLKAAWDPVRLIPRHWRSRTRGDISVYFRGAFLLPDGEHLAVLVGRSEAGRVADWLSAECKAKADELVAAHDAAVAQFDKDMQTKRAEKEAFYSKPEMERFKGFVESKLAEEELFGRPILTAEEILPLLPRGAVFEFRTKSPEASTKRAIKAIAESKLPLSRGGSYQGIPPPTARGGALALVTWAPYSGPPAYPEVRAAVEARVRSAFKRPRKAGLARPQLELGVEPAASGTVDGDQPGEILSALADLRLDTPDADERADRSRQEREQRGFEALAWYQAHHVWSEASWGIFFGAAKLDELAVSILDDLKSSSAFVPQGVAALLAFGLTLAHEQFHARVEAATTWLELSTLQPRHIRYSERVYDALKLTPQWLEEALANWSAWAWFKSEPIQAAIGRYSSRAPQIERVVENTLDLSPPGYRDWRQGDSGSAWRILATQLAHGKPTPSGPIGLPLESQLAGPFPYDFTATDVPVRFVGKGVIADRLLSRPATFNVPARDELERALKHFKHEKDRSGGKGSHEKWTGPDERAFILPKRDPVSGHVFRSFLQHVRIDKTTYVRSVRPQL